MQAERQPDYPLLYSLRGFRYCDLLLTEAERAAWQVSCSGGPRPPEDGDAHRATLQPSPSARRRRSRWVERNNWLLASPSTTSPWAAPRSTRRFWRLVTRSLPRAPPARRGRPPPRRHKTIFPAASSPAPGCAFSKANAPAPRARRATWTKPGKSPSAAPCGSSPGRHPPPPRPALLPRSAISLGIPRRRPRRRARAHREMRLRAAQGRAGGCRAGDWRGRSLTPSWPPPS